MLVLSQFLWSKIFGGLAPSPKSVYAVMSPNRIIVAEPLSLPASKSVIILLSFIFPVLSFPPSLPALHYSLHVSIT
jgi:hypothetical protein